MTPSKALIFLVILWVNPCVAQQLVSTQLPAQWGLFSEQHCVLIGQKQVQVLDSAYQIVFEEIIADGIIAETWQTDHTIYVSVSGHENGQESREIFALDLTKRTLSGITEAPGQKRTAADLLRKGNKALLAPWDGEPRATTMTAPIRHLDTSPFDPELSLAVSREGFQLYHRPTGRTSFHPKEGLRQAYFAGGGRLVLLQNEKAAIVSQADLEAPEAMASGVQHVIMKPDRSGLLLLLEDRTEIWKLSESNPQATLPIGPIAGEFVAELSDDTFQAYLLYKTIVDEELMLKEELFVKRASSETESSFENRQREGRKHFDEIIGHYSGLHQATRSTLAQTAKLEESHQQAVAGLLSHTADSLALVDQERQLLLTAERVKKSYEEFSTKITAVGSYDTNQEQYLVTIDGKQVPIKINLAEARAFKLDYAEHVVIGARQLEKTGAKMAILGYQVMTPQGQIFKSLAYKEPLFVPKEQRDQLLTKQLTRGQNAATETTAAQTKFSKFLYNKIKTYDYHALIIGVDEYAHESVIDLDNPISDGQQLQRVLTERYRFDPENITFLQNPTRTEIIESFDNLSADITNEDNLLIFYAGHGIWDKNLQQGYWLPSDAKAESKAAWLSNSTIRDYITGIDSKHTLLVADACFSGGIFKTRSAFVGETLGFANIFKLSSRKAITSGNLTPVQDISIFMKYFIKTLDENTSPLLAAEELFSSLKIPVANNNTSGQVPQYGDILNAGDEGGDFVFILDQSEDDL